MAEFNQILTSLGSLNQRQLAEVRKRTTFLLQHKTGPVPVEDEDWLLIGILSELSRRGLDGGDFRLKKASSYGSFQTQSENVRTILLNCCPDIDAVHRRALGGIAAETLASYLASWPYEVSRESMLRYVNRIPQAIDWAFPGYMASGLLGIVIHENRHR